MMHPLSHTVTQIHIKLTVSIVYEASKQTEYINIKKYNIISISQSKNNNCKIRNL